MYFKIGASLFLGVLVSLVVAGMILLVIEVAMPLGAKFILVAVVVGFVGFMASALHYVCS
jgi:hypothetical protein